MGRLAYFSSLTVHFLLNWNTSGIYVQSAASINCLALTEKFELEHNNFTSVISYPESIQYNCWESQLTYQSKLSLTRKYNAYRQRMAKSSKINSMLQMVWHWRLEIESIIIDSDETVWVKFEGLDHKVDCEGRYNIIDFASGPPTQANLVSQMDYILEGNHMNDFKNDVFSRASAMYFGCSFGSSYESSWFACTYCSKESNISDIPKDCPSNMKKGYNKDYPDLCGHTQYVDFYFCEPDDPCPSDSMPPGRRSSQTVNVKKIYPVQTLRNASWFIVTESTFQGGIEITGPLRLVRPVYNRELAWLFYYGKIPENTYRYKTETLKILNSTVQEQTGGLSSIRIPEYNRFKFFGPMRQQKICCILEFIFMCLLFCIIIIASMFSYMHHVMEPEYFEEE